MTALAVQTAVVAPQPGPAPVAAKDDADSGFSALLGRLHDPKPAAKPIKEDRDGQDNPDTAASNAMQSLEAALASLAALSTPAAAAKSDALQTEKPASALDDALSAAANALEATGWDASGKTPLKTLLESDPSLGLTDFQIKTFLAAAGATPAKTGATPLGADSAWSPLEAAKAALAAALPATDRPAESPLTDQTTALASAALPTGRLENARSPAGDAKPLTLAASQPSGIRPPGLRGLSAAELHGLMSDANAVTAASSADTLSRRDSNDAANSGAAPAAAVQAASTDAAFVPTVTVPFANLPGFIAEQAASLTASADETSASTSAGETQTPKAAQAVKELHISLDPADLGEMTLKLRLTGGKLSVTISVANPSTLSAIEDDRNLITARLASGDQSLEGLTIQRQNPSAASQQENSASHGFANESFSQSDSQDKRASDGGERPKPAHRGGAGGTFDDLVV